MSSLNYWAEQAQTVFPEGFSRTWLHDMWPSVQPLVPLDPLVFSISCHQEMLTHDCLVGSFRHWHTCPSALESSPVFNVSSRPFFPCKHICISRTRSWCTFWNLFLRLSFSFTGLLPFTRKGGTSWDCLWEPTSPPNQYFWYTVHPDPCLPWGRHW